MKRSEKIRRGFLASAALGVWIAGTSPSSSLASAPTTAPTTGPMTGPSAVARPRTQGEVMAGLTSDQAVVNRLLGPHNASLKTDERRQAVRADLLPPLQRMQAGLNELAQLRPGLGSQTAVSSLQLTVMQSLLGDPAAAGRIRALAASADPAGVVSTEACQWLQRWYTSEADDVAQRKLVDDLARLDRAHPDSECLALLTVAMSREAVSPDQADQMLSVVAADMEGPTPRRVKAELTAKREATDQDAKVAGKPLVLTGALVDGHPFSTAGWRGKVILVDFWATWCVPCRAELPRIGKLYQAYHDKGLEVLGVSNDFDGDALKTFVAQSGMAWPQLFDPAAAAKRSMHPITIGQRIDGIPVMYLIDKKGNLRTVNGRLNAEEMIPKLLAEPG